MCKFSAVGDGDTVERAQDGGTPFAHKPGCCARESQAAWERQISGGEEGGGEGLGANLGSLGPFPARKHLGGEGTSGRACG